MKKDEITIGGTYLAKVSDNVVQVRIDAANPRGGWEATNLSTGKKVRIKSAQRLRGPAAAATTPQRDEHRTPEQDAQAAAAGAAADQVPSAGASTPKTKNANKAKKATAANDRPRKLSLLEAAVQVLSEAKQPMTAKQMVEQVAAQGLWHSAGKTPAATLYSAILREMAAKGEAGRFAKTDRGRFALKA